jgi:ABC-2 type transport system permease protein
VASRVLGRSGAQRPRLEQLLQNDLPIFVIILLALSGVLSLTAIISIYREGGILKRLRATPLSPLTILTSHVIVKMTLSALTLGLLALAGRRIFSGPLEVEWISFVPAVVLVILSLLSMGFVIASIVPTARFAQPLGSVLLYPQIVISGLFFPIDALPGGWQTVAHLSPLSHAVTLLRGVWTGGSLLEHGLAVGALVLNLAFCSALASRIFRWQ